jgi:hypothetical protein
MRDLYDESEAMLWKENGHSVVVLVFVILVLHNNCSVLCAGQSQCIVVQFRSRYCCTEIMEGFQMDLSPSVMLPHCSAAYTCA